MYSQKTSLTGQFARYVTPSVISMVIFSFYTMADGIFVARGVGEKHWPESTSQHLIMQLFLLSDF